MHRIDAAGATAENRFTLGNGSLGIPATTLDDAWPNAVQEEICKFIESRGMTLEKGNWTQLTAAILDATKYISAKTVTVNVGGAAASAAGTGIEVQENALISAYIKVSANRNKWQFKAPNSAAVIGIGGEATVVGDIGLVSNVFTFMSNGLAFKNSTGTPILAAADNGGHVLGATSVAAATAPAHGIVGALYCAATGTADAEKRLQFGVNAYSSGWSGLPARNSVGGTLGGGLYQILARNSNVLDTHTWFCHKTTDGNTDNAANVGGITGDGAFRLGPSTGLTGTYHRSNGSIVATRTGSLTGSGSFSTGGALILSANTYGDASGFKAINTATGYSTMQVSVPTLATSQAFRFYANYQDAQTADAAILGTNEKLIGYAVAGGYWSLGISAPEIAIKKLTGTWSANSSSITVAHGLTGARIKAVYGKVTGASGYYAMPGPTSLSLHIGIYFDDTNVGAVSYNSSFTPTNLAISNRAYEIYVIYEAS